MNWNWNRKVVLILVTAAVTLSVAGCRRSEVVRPPAPPPAPAAPPERPTVSLQASQTFIQKGESVTLNWTSTNATEVTLSPGIGRVAAQGSTRVTPEASTTYSIAATGPGGTATDSVRITVGAGAPEVERTPDPAKTLEELFRANVYDAFFDYDKADIRPDAREALAKTAQFLRTHPQIRVIIEGHCDERGSTEYNLALGDRRAQSAKQFLISLGVAAERIETVSYGKERPFCFVSHEDCWQQNRRAHFVLAKP